MAELADWIGSIAAVMTTGAFVPQVWRAWVTRSTDDLSNLWLATYVVGLSLWLIYGLLLGAMPVIMSNVITLALLFVLVAIKLGLVRRAASG